MNEKNELGELCREVFDRVDMETVIDAFNDSAQLPQ